MTGRAIYLWHENVSVYSAHLAQHALRRSRLLIALGCPSADARAAALRSGADAALGHDATDEEVDLVIRALTALRWNDVNVAEGPPALGLAAEAGMPLDSPVAPEAQPLHPSLPSARSTAFGADLLFDAARHLIARGDRQEDLTLLEALLLDGLLKAPGLRLSRAELRQAGWGNDFDTGTNRVDFHMTHIRKKLALIESSVKVVAVRQYGYALQQ